MYDWFFKIRVDVGLRGVRVFTALSAVQVIISLDEMYGKYCCFFISTCSYIGVDSGSIRAMFLTFHNKIDEQLYIFEEKNKLNMLRHYNNFHIFFR